MADKTSRNHFKSQILAVTLAAGLSSPAIAQTPDSTLVDPTRPVRFVASQQGDTRESGLRLQAIFIRADGREAVVNGRRVRAGQTIDQARILAIYPDRIAYERGGARAELRLLPRIAKSAVAEE